MSNYIDVIADNDSIKFPGVVNIASHGGAFTTRVAFKPPQQTGRFAAASVRFARAASSARVRRTAAPRPVGGRPSHAAPKSTIFTTVGRQLGIRPPAASAPFAPPGQRCGDGGAFYASLSRLGADVDLAKQPGRHSGVLSRLRPKLRRVPADGRWAASMAEASMAEASMAGVPPTSPTVLHRATSQLTNPTASGTTAGNKAVIIKVANCPITRAGPAAVNRPARPGPGSTHSRHSRSLSRSSAACSGASVPRGGIAASRRRRPEEQVLHPPAVLQPLQRRQQTQAAHPTGQRRPQRGRRRPARRHPGVDSPAGQRLRPRRDPAPPGQPVEQSLRLPDQPLEVQRRHVPLQRPHAAPPQLPAPAASEAHHGLRPLHLVPQHHRQQHPLALPPAADPRRRAAPGPGRPRCPRPPAASPGAGADGPAGNGPGCGSSQPP